MFALADVITLALIVIVFSSYTLWHAIRYCWDESMKLAEEAYEPIEHLDLNTSSAGKDLQ